MAGVWVLHSLSEGQKSEPPNKEMKLTNVERIGRSQLISGVVRIAGAGAGTSNSEWRSEVLNGAGGPAHVPVCCRTQCSV